MNKAAMCSRLMSLGVPKMAASAIINQIGTWERSCGSEWTVRRLKEIKQLFVSETAGIPYAPAMFIARNRKGYPKGPIGYLFERFNRRKLNLLLSGLQSYTSFVSVEPTKEQKKKFFSALESEDERGLNSKLSIIPKELRSEATPQDPPTLPEYCVRDTRAPGPRGKSCKESDYISIAVAAGESNAVRLVMAEFEHIFSKVVPLDDVLNIEPQPYSVQHLHTLGQLSGIQEPGFKLRVIANPHRVLQAALEPLKNELGRVLRRIPQDCTFDQESALPVIQGWLREGFVVHSVDLSDATTLFPWNVTKDYLLRAFPNFSDFIQIMDRCSTGPWRTNLRGKEEVVHFYRGQPLGLGPSFFAFALTHHCVVRGICRKLRKDPDCYRILGDDIVIRDDHVKKVYLKTLANFGCKISASKSLSSPLAAEFAGYLITPDRIGKGMKWRQVSFHSVLEHVKHLGKSALGYLTPVQRALVKLVAPIPTFLGGLGWSDGRSLLEFFQTPQGELALQVTSEKLEDLAGKTVPFENLDYHLRRLKNGLVNHGLSEPSLALRLISDSATWRQAMDQSYRLGRTDLLSPEAPGESLRYLGKAKPGYFPIVRTSGDPRPTLLAIALVYYQLHIHQGGRRDTRVERAYEHWFKRPYSEIIYEVNAFKERKLKALQTKKVKVPPRRRGRRI